MITSVIFDLDGVLVNSEPVHQRLEDELYRELGLNIPPDMKKAIVGTSAMDAWKMIRERFSLSKTPEELLVLGRGRYLKEVRNGKVHLSEGVPDLIQMFRDHDFKFMLASSATSTTIMEVLKYHRLDGTFKIFVGGDQVTRSKPDPEIFLKTAALAGVPVSECLVIEDASNGVRAAKEAGMFCIGFENPFTGEQDLSMADAVVNKLSDINFELINRIQNKE